MSGAPIRATVAAVARSALRAPWATRPGPLDLLHGLAVILDDLPERIVGSTCGKPSAPLRGITEGRAWVSYGGVRVLASHLDELRHFLTDEARDAIMRPAVRDGRPMLVALVGETPVATIAALSPSGEPPWELGAMSYDDDGWAWSLNPQEPRDRESTREEAIEAALAERDDEPTIYLWRTITIDPGAFVPSASEIAEIIENRALGTLPSFDTWPLSTERLEQLHDIVGQIQAWAREYAPATWWEPIGEPEAVAVDSLPAAGACTGCEGEQFDGYLCPRCGRRVRADTPAAPEGTTPMAGPATDDPEVPAWLRGPSCPECGTSLLLAEEMQRISDLPLGCPACGIGVGATPEQIAEVHRCNDLWKAEWSRREPDDDVPRTPGCRCQWDGGDSPCPVHGDDAQVTP